MHTNPEILAWFLGGWELGVVALLALVIFYGKKMPEVGRNLGKSIVEFKKGLTGKDDEEEETQPAKPAPTDQNSGNAS